MFKILSNCINFLTLLLLISDTVQISNKETQKINEIFAEFLACIKNLSQFKIIIGQLL